MYNGITDIHIRLILYNYTYLERLSLNSNCGNYKDCNDTVYKPVYHDTP